MRQAARKRANHQTEITNINASTPQVSDVTTTEKDGGKASSELGVGNIDFDLSPSDAMADMTSWEQFDSIVRVKFLALRVMLTVVGYDGVAGARGHHSPSRAEDGIAIKSSGRSIVYIIKQDQATQQPPSLQPTLLPRAGSTCYYETCCRSPP